MRQPHARAHERIHACTFAQHRLVEAAWGGGGGHLLVLRASSTRPLECVPVLMTLNSLGNAAETFSAPRLGRFCL